VDLVHAAKLPPGGESEAPVAFELFLKGKAVGKVHLKFSRKKMPVPERVTQREEGRRSSPTEDHGLSTSSQELDSEKTNLSPKEQADLIRFMIDTGISRDHWPSLVESNRFCSAVVNGDGSELIRFLVVAKIPKDKWPSLLVKDCFCNAIERRKGHKLRACLDQHRVPREKWHIVLGIDTLCSAMARGRPVDLACFSI
jgi:hypothetical protein